MSQTVNIKQTPGDISCLSEHGRRAQPNRNPNFNVTRSGLTARNYQISLPWHLRSHSTKFCTYQLSSLCVISVDGRRLSVCLSVCMSVCLSRA